MVSFDKNKFLEDLESRKQLLNSIKNDNLEYLKNNIPDLIFELIRKSRCSCSVDVDGIYEHNTEYLNYCISFNRRTSEPLHVETNELYCLVVHDLNVILRGFEDDSIIKFIDSSTIKNYEIKNNYTLIKKM